MPVDSVSRLDPAAEAGPGSARPGQPLDETTIVSRAQDGDLAAFEQLVDRYQGPLFRLAVRTMGGRDLAEDVVQDALLTAWRRLPTLQEPAAFRTWIYRTVSYRCIDALRRRRHHLELDEERDATPARTGPAETVEHTESWQELKQAVAELSPRTRLCWVLREIEGLSYAEIADIVDQPVSTVRGRLARARTTLAERMTPWR